MRYRIVVYKDGNLTDDLLDEIEKVAGVDRKSIVSLLRSRPAVALRDLEEAPARGLLGLLRAQGHEADLESMEPERDKVEWLKAEVPKWVKRGLMHPNSVPLVYGNYGIEPPPATPTQTKETDPGRLVRAVITLGAILVGLGLILFIASNWQKIPPALKISGSMALTLAALHAAYRLKFVRSSQSRLAAALFLVALFGIGGVVILIFQVYHVQADSYLLTALWGGLCLPVAVFLRFKPGLYLASGLWLASYWLYAGSHAHLPWLYAVLLLGFLLPYSLALKDKRLYNVHLATLMVALASTPATGDFWLCSAWILALVILRIRFRTPLYDWLLVLGFLFWHITFMVEFQDFPNAFYAVPLAYFFYQGLNRQSNSLMAANIVNSLLWLISFFVQITARADLAQLSVTGFLLWMMTTGMLCSAIGRRIRPLEEWKLLSGFLRYGSGAVVSLVIYILSFRFYVDEAAFFSSPLFLWSAVTFGAAAVALFASQFLSKTPSDEGDRTYLVLLALVALSLLLSVLASPALGVHVLLFNVILFVGALCLMLRGHQTQQILRYNIGIAAFVVLITSRYFDTFVEFLPRSIFFVLGGLFLMGWAVLVERQRRRAAPGGDHA